MNTFFKNHPILFCFFMFALFVALACDEGNGLDDLQGQPHQELTQGYARFEDATYVDTWECPGLSSNFCDVYELLVKQTPMLQNYQVNYNDVYGIAIIGGDVFNSPNTYVSSYGAYIQESADAYLEFTFGGSKMATIQFFVDTGVSTMADMSQATPLAEPTAIIEQPTVIEQPVNLVSEDDLGKVDVVEGTKCYYYPSMTGESKVLSAGTYQTWPNPDHFGVYAGGIACYINP